MKNDMKIIEHEPDQLDKWCDLIFDAMKDIPKEERLGVLDQCIDYLKLGESCEE